jgi:hypothetical protein
MKRVAKVLGAAVSMVVMLGACGSVEQEADYRILEVHLDAVPDGDSFSARVVVLDSEESVVSEQESGPIYLAAEDDPDDILKRLSVELRLQRLGRQIEPVFFKSSVEKILDGDWGRYRSITREFLPREMAAEVIVSLEGQGDLVGRYEVIYLPVYGNVAEIGTRLALN